VSASPDQRTVFRSTSTNVILAIDAGNSRVKWALHDGKAFAQEGWAAVDDPETLGQQLRNLPEPSRVVVANVAGAAVGEALRALLKRWRAETRWVSGRRSQCGVTSLYDDPAQLGPDRWAAIIGARQRCTDAVLVANAGTALTVDALSAAGEFLGGIIVPGFDLMHEALASNTARLSAQHGRFESFPRATPDAITTGAIQAMCGAIDRMSAQVVAAGHGKPLLLVGGGTAPMIAPHLARPAQVIEKLVLEGLVRIGQDPA
jgi:type III pantothenate kinase